MDKKPRKKKKETDFAITAFRVVQEATKEAEETPAQPPIAETQSLGSKNPAAVALGRLGGLKGGKARAKKLTLEQRKGIAKKAALARWGKPE